MTVYIGHVEAAERLFATGELPTDTDAAARLILRHYREHPNPADAVAAMSERFMREPGFAAAWMRACLAIAPDEVELPDALGPDALIGCEVDACVRTGPLTLVGRRLYCPEHHAAGLRDALLAETQGDDDDEH